MFHAGPEDREEAIAVFTTRESAARYIQEAGWAEEYEVGELQPIQLLRWILTAHEQGTEMMVVNPDRAAQLQGEPQAVITIREPLGGFAEVLRSEIIKQSERNAGSSQGET